MKPASGKEALKITIELWEWLELTGKKKEKWDGWTKYGRMRSDCPLCEYAVGCSCCPLVDYYKPKWSISYCCEIGFRDWVIAHSSEDKKKYSSLFLEKLKEVRNEQTD